MKIWRYWMMNEELIIDNMVEFIEKKEKEFHIAKAKGGNANNLRTNVINQIFSKFLKETDYEDK